MTHFLQTIALPTQQDRILSHKEHKQLKTLPHVTYLCKFTGRFVLVYKVIMSYVQFTI